MRSGVAPSSDAVEAPPTFQPLRRAGLPPEQSSPLREDFRSGFDAQDLFAAASRLHAKKVLGSYAASSRLESSCEGAGVGPELRRGEIGNWLRGAENEANYSRRADARERILRRCAAISQVNPLPGPGDAEGEKYIRALEEIFFPTGEASLRAALQEMARQGHWEGLKVQLQRTCTWDGQAFCDDRAILEQAWALALLRYRAVDGRSEEDVRLLGACYLFGACGHGYTVESVATGPISAEQRTKILEVAASIELAIREGTVLSKLDYSVQRKTGRAQNRPGP